VAPRARSPTSAHRAAGSSPFPQSPPLRGRATPACAFTRAQAWVGGSRGTSRQGSSIHAPFSRSSLSSTSARRGSPPTGRLAPSARAVRSDPLECPRPFTGEGGPRRTRQRARRRVRARRRCTPRGPRLHALARSRERADRGARASGRIGGVRARRRCTPARPFPSCPRPFTGEGGPRRTRQRAHRRVRAPRRCTPARPSPSCPRPFTGEGGPRRTRQRAHRRVRARRRSCGPLSDALPRPRRPSLKPLISRPISQNVQRTGHECSGGCPPPSRHAAEHVKRNVTGRYLRPGPAMSRRAPSTASHIVDARPPESALIPPVGPSVEETS
jgi:hypothetical protein